MNELEMAQALGLVKRRENTRVERTPHTEVILSVRPKAGGVTRRFTFHAKTISSLQADIEAFKAARAEGLEPQFVIDRVVIS